MNNNSINSYKTYLLNVILSNSFYAKYNYTHLQTHTHTNDNPAEQNTTHIKREVFKSQA